MSWWDAKATVAQDYVIGREFDSTTEVNEEIAQRATLHSRQDIVLLVSLLSSLNRQLSWAIYLLIAGLILLFLGLILLLALAVKSYTYH